MYPLSGFYLDGYTGVSVDTMAIIGIMDAYNNIGQFRFLYNMWGSGHQNGWKANLITTVIPAIQILNNGGWNSNNYATSLLEAGGIDVSQSMMPNAPGFGTPLPVPGR